MALAESFLRRVHKSGIIPKVVKLLPVISFVFALASVAWLLVLPQDGQFRNTYISENALMPGQVTSYFRESEWNIVRGYRSETKKWNYEESARSNPMLETWLTDLGLKVAHFEDDKTNSSTLYAIMHAPRGDNTESVVLVAPYITSTNEDNIGGLALAPALARYFGRMSIWSKNVIFVFPRDGHASLRSWVEAYHTSLDLTAGSIEAAIVLEYAKDSDNFDHLQLIYEGLNGQLPNLDLINTITTIARNENMHVGIQSTPGEELTRRDYGSRLRTLARGILHLAMAGLHKSTFGCEAFSGWQIQAVTIRAVGTGGPDITQFGRIVDSTFRAVNNLLEKFHQSFFFYLLLSPKHFVSIGTYLPSAVLLAVAFALSSLCCLANGVTGGEYLIGMGTLLMTFTAIELVCLIFAFALPHLVETAADPYSQSRLIIIVAIVVSFLLSLKQVVRAIVPSRFSKVTTYSLIAFSLYFIAMLITTLLIVHFALAFTIGLCSLPLTFIQPQISAQIKNKGNAFKTKILACLLVSSPITAILLLGYFYDGEKEAGIVTLTQRLLTSWDELQCWTWFVVALGWFPAWISIAIAYTFGTFEEAGVQEVQEEKPKTE
ncbi:hypothetical protein FT663_03575 [Candidozyma haemuli var. vulneris]|uniref:GPI transamidase component GAA1 n=1 Tax=Candidozyma haemuli TaxID=45357 RepID=A0A2V1ANV0_9ASCO|nr:hypothetical protein CXQ85_001714 [[Candida] haemuloni]KAF3989549.1 hypothetical protein FT663_03575 [[Candida] haemuloni var. vulneris]KAF3989816.1 hypothetical protein FT662_02596 [[Candida] haemuloni var. vulneris]PVH19937.1 hypothetical protein CXQ85_001714 [[Candida] haemuloni]